MSTSTRFPIRVKILTLTLCLISVVVAAIIWVMASLFERDKMAYIRDLTSVTATHISREVDTVLSAYAEELGLFAEIIFDESLSLEQKERIIQLMFNQFTDFVAVSARLPGEDPVSVFDGSVLDGYGLTKSDLLPGAATGMTGLAAGTLHVENRSVAADLPLMTITRHRETADSGAAGLLSVTVRLDRVLDITRRSSAYTAYLVDSDGHLLAHPELSRILERKTPELPTGFDLRTADVSSRTVEFDRAGKAVIAGLSGSRAGDFLAVVEIPRSAAYLTARDLLNHLVVVALLLFSVAGLSALLLSRRLTSPLERLSRAVRQVGTGNFDIAVEASSGDEIGALSSSFNQMTSELRDREDALRSAQRALVQSEKMAAFGQLGAGIAHEVKNPLAGIRGYAQLAMRKVDPESPVAGHLKVIEKETGRCTDILQNLLRFAREEAAEFHDTSINAVISDAVEIVDHQLAVNGVTIEQDLAGDLPTISASANQLQQVLMNLAINAQQAMGESGGRVAFSTRALETGGVRIRVEDNGPGMSEDIRKRIFEPFFTTKEAGQGTGLGLAVTYGIVEAHEGTISVDSELGRGTTFTIDLPGGNATGSQ